MSKDEIRFDGRYDDEIQDTIESIKLAEHQNLIKVLDNIFYNDAIKLPGGDIVISKDVVEYYKDFINTKYAELDANLKQALDDKAKKDYHDIVCHIVGKIVLETSD